MNKFDPWELDDEQIDALIEVIELRQQQRQQINEEQLQLLEEEEYSKKHCNECGEYLTCKERRKNKCPKCGK